MSQPSLAAPLASPVFRALWLGAIVSNLGTMVQTVGAGWLMATIAQESDMVALVQAANTLPVMLFSVAAGVFADNHDRRRVLLVAQGLMIAASLMLALTVLAGLITPWLLLSFTFLLGCGTALYAPSWQAAVGDVLPREQIASGVTLNSIGLNLTRSLGPALGGLIVATAGAAAAFLVNAVSFLPLVLALARWKTAPAPAGLPREGFYRAVASGLGYVAMSPNLMSVMARGFLFGLSGVAILALLPLVARDLVGGGAVSYGLLLGAFGIGAIAGGIGNARLRARFSGEAIARGAFLVFAAASALIALSDRLWLSAILLLPVGAGWVLALSLFNTVIQLSTPRWVVGRTLSIYQTATFGGMTLGAWLWGSLAEARDTPEALLCAGAAALIGALIGLRFALPEPLATDLQPLDRFREPQGPLDISPRSGPVRVMVDYRIAPEQAGAFQSAMAQRRRVRLRDGARHWVLLRDIEDPLLWRETYQFPTWIEYIRCARRSTRADAELTLRLRALCRDGEAPLVRRMIERHGLPAPRDAALKGDPGIL